MFRRFHALIPARSGSKRVENKNLRNLAGRPLIEWTLEAAANSQELEQVFVSTDSEEIRQAALQYNFAAPELRPKHLATDEAKMIDVMRHVVLRFELPSSDYLVLLQPTSPLRCGSHISEAIGELAFGSEADGLVSVQRMPKLFDPSILQTMTDDNHLTSIVKGETLVENPPPEVIYFARNGPAILITKVETILSGKKFGAVTLGYEMDAVSSIDIDTDDDFFIAEQFMKRRLEKR